MPDCMPLLAVCDFTMGQSPSSDTYNTNGDGMPFYQGNADFGKRSPSPRVWCNSPKKTANEGDILISVRAPIGAINIAAEQCCIGRGLAALAVRPDAATRDYLEHYLRYKRPELERRGTGSTFKAVGKKVFAEMTLPIVSVDEQSEIAKKLNNALELQEEAASQISMLDELVKSRFVEMFGDLSLNEQGWPIMDFDSFATIDTHMTNDFEAIADWPHIGIDSIEAETGVISGYRTVAEDGVRSGKYPFTEKHIIYSKIRPNLNKVALPSFRGVCSADAYPILPTEGVCNREFLAFVMRSKLFLEYILPLSGRAQMPKVNKQAVQGFKMPVPPIALQDEFAVFVQQVDKLKFETQQAIEKLQLLYDSLAQEYFGS